MGKKGLDMRKKDKQWIETETKARAELPLLNYTVTFKGGSARIFRAHVISTGGGTITFYKWIVPDAEVGTLEYMDSQRRTAWLNMDYVRSVEVEG